MKPQLALFLFVLFVSTQAFAQATDAPLKNDITNLEKKKYFTKQLEGNAPSIDGKLDDVAWNAVEWGNDFTQRQPYENVEPTQKTAFKILYDLKNLYIAFRCYDTEPDKIVKRMSRRDGFEGDWVEVNIDSYHDLRTAFSFTISASGVKGDEFISNDGNNWDGSWDPIYYAKTNIDDQGWTAELRIPLSQLRFPNKENHVWGIQFTRRDFRKEERSVWQFVPRNANTWVSSFGELHGITGIKPQKQLELQPYLLAQADSYKKEEGNPFATGYDRKFNLGLDGKIGVTSDLTIDFTINPDFGQVEADPSALALDGFQIFFSERRPFFIEGRNIFNYRLTGSAAGGPFESDRLFYSRRIGGAPSGYPNTAEGEYVNVPTNTTILGAAKFTGKTSKGTSIGIMESVTQKEYAQIDLNGERRKEIVEPLTNFFVGRLQQDFNGGNTVIGGMFNAVNRDLDDTPLDFLHKSAYSGGFDFTHRWKNESWVFSGNTSFSKVNGTKEAITGTQQRFEHNFQRTDADHLKVDTSLTSLTGHGGTLKIGRFGGGKNFMFEAGVTWRSPELELNDIGFLRSTDEITHFFWAGYRINKPFSIFRRMGFNYNHWQSWDFSGLHTFAGWNVNGNATFKNNAYFNTGFNIMPYDLSSRALRGGPMLRQDKRINNWINYGTDERKKFRVHLNAWHQWAIDSPSRQSSYSLWATYRPMNTLEISVGPDYSKNKLALQYVTNVEMEDGSVRYLNATIDQKTISATVRLNYTINPNLTIQYYGSPFISKGNYSDFKHIVDPMNKEFHERYVSYSDKQVTYNDESNSYAFDDNTDGDADYEIGNPDFNFMQFRSNLVLRWEYIPGSEIYLVWSQGTTNGGDPNDRLFTSLRENLFEEKPHNIFLLKYTYRFIR